MVRLMVVGGFLGAGKTTLLHATAQRLQAQGLRVGLITNDQAPGLVDTGLLRAQGLMVREVAGSCFCCDFPGLLAAANDLGQVLGVDAILAEPVGSCTDLSATIMQPLKDRYRDAFSCAPLSVLCDAARLAGWLDGTTGIHPDAAYIFRTQLAEADIIVLSQCDRVDPETAARLRQRLEEGHPDIRVLELSARTGAGIDAWLLALGSGAVGQAIATVDYDRYAAGEAVLGWLNGDYQLLRAGERDWRPFATQLLQRLQMDCSKRGAVIGHIKLLLRAGDGHLSANLVGNQDELRQEEALLPLLSDRATLTINARVQMAPAQLQGLVREELALVCGEAVAIHVLTETFLSPTRPEPTHRYDRIAQG